MILEPEQPGNAAEPDPYLNGWPDPGTVLDQAEARLRPGRKRKRRPRQQADRVPPCREPGVDDIELDQDGRPAPVDTAPSTNGTSREHATGQEPEQDAKADFHLTDVGNGQRLRKAHGENIRWCDPWAKWLCWDGTHWAPDDSQQLKALAKDTIQQLYKDAARRLEKLSRELAQATDDEEKARIKEKVEAVKTLINHALKSESARSVNAMIDLARSEPGIPILPEHLDRHPFLVNALNGTINLRTGDIRPHMREDYLTKIAPVVYDPDAQCPLWERSLRRWMDANQDLVVFLQRVVGYSLTGDVSEQLLLFFYGLGSNGKSTFLLVILAMLGDYAMQAVSELLMAKHNEAHPTERADLFGRRLVATIETEEGRRMAEALMKQLTGGDKIRARRMREDFWEFEPTHKIILAANHKPAVRGTDYAVWRRIKLVPFTVTISPEEKDKDLAEELKGELPGILNWALRGCLDWQRYGLGEPDEVRQATAEYQAEQDTVQGFIDECCHVHAEAKAQSSALLAAFITWSGDKLMTAPAFRKRMKDKGFQSTEGTGGRYFWRGLALKQDTPEGADSGGEWG